MRPRLECCYFRVDATHPARAFVEGLEARGLELRLSDDRLVVEPRSRFNEVGGRQGEVAEFLRQRRQGETYERLARTLEYTARQHCPGWDVTVERLDEAALPPLVPASGNPSHVWNTWKLDWWRDRVLGAPDGARVLLIDGDTFVTRPLDPIWDLDFDVAYTLRAKYEKVRGLAGVRTRGGGIPFNAGVIFLRVSERTRAFMRSWSETNLRFLRDAQEHEPWRKVYAGINQAALGYLLEQGEHGCHIAELPCAEWNLVEWGLYEPEVTRIVHVKSSLRRATFAMPGAARSERYLQLSKLWERTERSMKKRAAPVAAVEE